MIVFAIAVVFVIILMFSMFTYKRYQDRTKIELAPGVKPDPKKITMMLYIKNFGISGKQCCIDIRQSGDYYISDEKSIYRTGILNSMQRSCVDKLTSMTLRDSYRNTVRNPIGADSSVSRLVINGRTIYLGILSLDCIPMDVLGPVLQIDRIITGPLVGVNWSESRQKFPVTSAGPL